MTAQIPRPGRLLPLIGAVCATLGLALAAPVQAYPDARVDAQIRPNFGGLITPPLRTPYQPNQWRKPDHKPKKPYPHPARPYPPLQGGYLNSLSIDCADPNLGPYPVSDALWALADGGVLFIRARGGVCRETLYIDRPVTIIGEGSPAFATGSEPQPARLSAPAGAPCIRIAPGTRGVEIRDLVIEADQGGRRACIEAVDAEVALVNTYVRYSGEAAAIFVSGGRLIGRQSTIEARTNDAAVLVDTASLDFSQVRIAADVRGLDITPAAGESRLTQVGVVSEGGTLPGSTGVTVRGLRSGGGKLVVRNSYIGGWITGLYVDRGAKLELVRSRVRARRGVISDWGEVVVRESAVWGDEYGGYFAGGAPVIEYNRFGGPRGGLMFDSQTRPALAPNYLYASDLCDPYAQPQGLYCQYLGAGPLQAFAAPDAFGYPAYGPHAYGWSHDGYERGYQLDGAPVALPPPPPPTRRGRRPAY
ncbi:MAG: hypothetical protein Q7V15_15440 [Phenylobacterium sp.]|uniref:hypothetical protein n=1 Tax=Phenylobacterium sp. TaxID=1871053 RepID=UPI00271CD2DA|nr:hypothetical protein [Phenylobacterium sp.]MDO8902738.1 hypothetical protein [Phenylobacterium sp.]